MQYARPSSDIENPGGWTTGPLWTLIDEEPFDDGDFAHSPKTATEDSFTIGLSGVTDPEVHTGHVVRIRAETGVSGTFKYELMQGAVVIKDSGNVVLTIAFAEYNMTLSEAEAANITDYAALRVRVTAVITQKNQYQDVSWIRVDIPDLAGEEHSGSSSISGNGSTTGTIKKGGIGSALKSAGGMLLAIGLAGMLAIASITGGGSQLVVAKKAVSDSVFVSGNGPQLIVGEKSIADSIVISGGGSVIATGAASEVEQHSGVVVVFGNGELQGAGLKVGFSMVIIQSNGALVSVGIKETEGISLISGDGSIIATGTKQEGYECSGSLVISGNGELASVGMKGAKAMISLSGNGILEATREKKPAKTKIAVYGLNDELKSLGTYEKKKNFTHAQLAADMNRFGWQWTENHIANMFAGIAAVSDEHKEFLRRYLLTKYYNETLKEE